MNTLNSAYHRLATIQSTTGKSLAYRSLVRRAQSVARIMKRTGRKRKANSTSSSSGNLPAASSSGSGHASTASARQPKEYIVERILDRRQRNGVTEYLLKWHGYSNSHNSWEPEENILSQKMLDDFNERYEQKVLHQHLYPPSSPTPGVTNDSPTHQLTRHMLLGVTPRVNQHLDHHHHDHHASNSHASNSSSGSSFNDAFGQIQSINRSLSFSNGGNRFASVRPASSKQEAQFLSSFPSPNSTTKLELEQIKHNIANVSRSALRCNSLGSRTRAHSTSSTGFMGKDRIKMTATSSVCPSTAQWMNHSTLKGLQSKLKAAGSGAMAALQSQSTQGHGGLMMAGDSSEEDGANINSASGRRRNTCVDLNLPVDKIYGATQNSAGELFYLVKWKNCSGSELVHSRLMEDRQPRAVLDFFRSHCRFN